MAETAKTSLSHTVDNLSRQLDARTVDLEVSASQALCHILLLITLQEAQSRMASMEAALRQDLDAARTAVADSTQRVDEAENRASTAAARVDALQAHVQDREMRLLKLAGWGCLALEIHFSLNMCL